MPDTIRIEGDRRWLKRVGQHTSASACSGQLRPAAAALALVDRSGFGRLRAHGAALVVWANETAAATVPLDGAASWGQRMRRV
jgi:hypothetical protein